MGTGLTKIKAQSRIHNIQNDKTCENAESIFQALAIFGVAMNWKIARQTNATNKADCTSTAG